jgi:hypothetical protein
MKIRTFIIPFLIFLCFGIILVIYDNMVAGFISFGLALMVSVAFITTKVIEQNKINKLDKKYYVLRKEELLKEYAKLTKEFEEGKLKQVTLVYLKLKEEYSLEVLKKFGLWLTKKFPADPSGIDEGIIILFVNIHERLMEELKEFIKDELKKENILIDFDFGYAIYKTNLDFEELKREAINNLEH